MKEKWKYDSFFDKEKRKTVYYKIQQTLTWQFYLRFAKLWFTPCNKCQEEIGTLWKRKQKLPVYKTTPLDLAFYDFVKVALSYLCEKCNRELHKRLETAELIFANKDYEPVVELQRSWLNDNDSFVEISKREFEENSGK